MIRWRRGRSASSSSSAAKAKHSRHARVMRAARVEEGSEGRVAFRNRFPRRAAHSFFARASMLRRRSLPKACHSAWRGYSMQGWLLRRWNTERRGRQATLGGADARGRTAARRTARRHGSGWRTTGFQGAGRLAMGAWMVARLAEVGIRQGGRGFASCDGVAGRMRQARHALCAAPSHRGASQLRPLSLRDALY